MNVENEAKRIHFDTIDSTQNYAKEKRLEREDLLVTATRQTGGRGTKGRLFDSSIGGVYLSKLSFYEDFPAKYAFKIMARAAVAVCKTLQAYGLRAVIKWPNDIFVNDKKISGILIENVFSGNKIDSSVVGIGLNVYNVLPDELLPIATTMLTETGEKFSVEEVTQRLIAALEEETTMEEYISFMGYMGRTATLVLGDERVHGTLLSVDDEGCLSVEIDGKIRRLTAAEVSIRF